MGVKWIAKHDMTWWNGRRSPHCMGVLSHSLPSSPDLFPSWLSQCHLNHTWFHLLLTHHFTHTKPGIHLRVMELRSRHILRGEV